MINGDTLKAIAEHLSLANWRVERGPPAPPNSMPPVNSKEQADG